MTSQFEAVGAQPKNPSRGKPIHVARMETGLVTNRSPLHDAASWYQSKYGGFPDALIDGSNMEVSNQLTLIRRPGLSQWSTVTVPDQVNRFYDWRTLTCGPKVVVDTSTSTYIQTTTTQSTIFTKAAGAGPGYYQGVANTLYYGDGIDLQKFILGTDCVIANGKTWNWGIVAPTTAPTVTSVASGSAATTWQANTFFTTMGLTVDSHNQVWQLIGVNADLSNTPNAQFGTAGTGSPDWNPQTLYGTTTEGSGTPIIWKNLGQISQWQPNFQYGDAGVAGTAAPVGIYDPGSQSIYLNFNHAGGLSQSGTSKPSFSGAVGSTYGDNGCHWFFYATYPGIGTQQAQPWKASHAYTAWYGSGGANGNNETCIEPFLFPPGSQAIYLQVPTNAGTSGSGYAPFPTGAVVSQQQPDGQLNWLCLGSSAWAPSTGYAAWTAQGTAFGCIKDSNGNMQVCLLTGSSAAVSPGTSATVTAAANASAGNTSYTGTFVAPYFLPGYPAVISGFSTSANNGSFTVVSCNATTLVVNNANGVSEGPITGTAVFNPWGSTYNTTITDGTTKWVCVGPPTTWVAGSGTTGIWNLPPSGWTPPSAAQNYGGSLVDSNTSLVEATVVSGKSGTVQPTWTALGTYLAENATSLTLTQVTVVNGIATYTVGPGTAVVGQTYLIAGFTNVGNNGLFVAQSPGGATLTVPVTTQINEVHAGTAKAGLTWYAESNVVTVGLTSTKGFYYAYSFESRLSTDIYNTTTIPGGGQLGNPTVLGTPTGSESGGVSTASPTTFIGPEITSSVNTISGIGSTDPQVDTIVIWRTLDGGSPSELFFLTEIPNPPAQGGIAQPWSFKDFLPDTSLNEFIVAPINETNNPPPAGFLPMAYHFERIWGAVGNFVYVSGGPDTLTGNPNESFSPSDFFEFPSPVTRIVPTATGVLVFLTSDVYAILGGPIFSTFFPSPMVPGVGLLHYDALDIHGGVIYLYTADNQFIAMDPSGGAQRMGGGIADKLALFDAMKVFVTVHENGNDNAIFVSDGVTGWYRLNPSQFPNATAVWSTFGAPGVGAGAVQSIEVSNGVHRLLVAGVGSNQPILMRDFSTYQDNGTPYTCSFTMGSINLVNPGQIAGLTFVNLRATRTGTTPSCAFLLNEVSGVFTTFPEAQAYPWQIYGATKQPTSLYSNAYYFRSSGKPSLAEHLQIKVSFPAENFANEVLSLTIYGVIEQPPED